MRDLREFALRLAAGLGLGVSLALLWVYTRSAPAICAPGGGCDVVRESAWASVAGIPTPVFGVLFFAAALVLAALRGRRARQLLVLWSASGAAVSVGLLILQAAVIGAYCAWCIVADGAAIAMLPLALAGRRETAYPRPRGHLATALALLVAAVPFGYGMVQERAAEPPPGPEEVLVDELPAPIADAQVEGKVTIVEFMDFLCPYCQKLHHDLRDILPDYGDDVAVVYMHVPNMQNQASQLAALAAICAEQRDLGEEMTHALMSVRNLGPQTVLANASQLGISQDELTECMSSDETMARIEESFEAAQAIEVKGLPTYFIGRERHQGAQSPEELRAAIDRARARGDDEL